MPVEQRLHVVERVDRDPLAADLALGERVVGVVAHQARHVEGRREARPARGRAGSGSARWSPRPCRSRRTGASSRAGRGTSTGRRRACRGTRRAARARARLGRQVVLGVERLDRLARDRREERVALGRRLRTARGTSARSPSRGGSGLGGHGGKATPRFTRAAEGPRVAAAAAAAGRRGSRRRLPVAPRRSPRPRSCSRRASLSKRMIRQPSSRAIRSSSASGFTATGWPTARSIGRSDSESEYA